MGRGAGVEPATTMGAADLALATPPRTPEVSAGLRPLPAVTLRCSLALRLAYLPPPPPPFLRPHPQGGFLTSTAIAVGELAVTPGAVEFKGVQPDLIYVMPLTIRNRGKTMCRVRHRRGQHQDYQMKRLERGFQPHSSAESTIHDPEREPDPLTNEQRLERGASRPA